MILLLAKWTLVIGGSACHRACHRASARDLVHRIPMLVFWMTTACCTQLSCTESMGAESSARSNIVLILADDLGYGDVGYQGAPDIQTPHIDRLASQSIRFTNMRANCTVCSPTRAAIMTGRYADRVGVPGVIRTTPADSWGYFLPAVPTIADRLRGSGYHTAIVGKWHLGLQSPNTPNERGFDLFHGFLGDMMDDYYEHRRGGINFMRHNGQEIEPTGHATELFTEWVIDYVRQRSEMPQQPFFLYLPYNAPHFPIQPPREWLQRTMDQYPQMDQVRAKNVAFVQHLDHHLGQFLAELDRLGLSDNTVVAFTSDNGGSLPHGQRNLPWRDGKQSHYDGGLKVPFLIRPTDKNLAGSICDYAGLTFDLNATFLELAGVIADSDSDAVSLAPVLAGKAMPGAERELYFVRREGNQRYVGGAYHAIVRGRWKLLHNDAFSPLELYDLETDPGEQNNVIDEHTNIANQLKSSLRGHIQRGGRVAWQP